MLATTIVVLFISIAIIVFWLIKRRKPTFYVEVNKSQPPNTLIIIGPEEELMNFEDQIYNHVHTGGCFRIHSQQVTPPAGEHDVWERHDYYFTDSDDYNNAKIYVIVKAAFFWQHYRIAVQVTETYSDAPRKAKRKKKKLAYFSGNPDLTVHDMTRTAPTTQIVKPDKSENWTGSQLAAWHTKQLKKKDRKEEHWRVVDNDQKRLPPPRD